MRTIAWRRSGRIVRPACAAACLLVAPLPLAAQAPPDAPPRVALVLSGGAARGAAHVGVLRVLEERRVPVDLVVGTSIGAVVGGFYAAGMSPDEIEAMLLETDWAEVFSDRSRRGRWFFRRKENEADFLFDYRLHFGKEGPGLPLGLLQGQKLTNVLKLRELATTTVTDFDRLPIPFRAVATDLATGEAVVLADGSLGEALRASMSVPGVFRPVRRDGRLLIDGGVASNLPVEVARELGAGIVLAVDASMPIGEEEPTSWVGVAERLVDLLTARTVERSRELLAPGDLLIVPDLAGVSSAAFDRLAEAVAAGEAAARAAGPGLDALAAEPAAWRAWIAARRRPAPSPPRIDRVEIANQGPLRDAVLRARLGQREGEPLAPAALVADLDDLFALGVFDPITFDLERHPDGGADLLLAVAPRASGLGELGLGLALEEDFEGNSSFLLRARYERLAIDPWGGEWRTDLSLGRESGLATEIYQPLDAGLRFFVAPALAARRREAALVVAGAALPEVEIASWGARLDAGRALGGWGELRAGLMRERRDPDGGDDPLLGRPFEVAQARLALRFDTLDDVAWPTRGGRGLLELARAGDWLGGETESETLDVEARWAFSAGATTLVPGLEAGLDLARPRGIADGEELGGLFRLSGYGPFELAGSESLLGRLIAYRRLDRRTLGIFQAGWYVGASVEAGNVFQADEAVATDALLAAGSLFVGADTPLGPVYLGLGLAEGGRRRFQLTVGRPFS